MSGTLIVKPLQGKLTHNTDTFTKMDPYCVVTCGSSSAKTSIHNGGGKTPVWKDTLTLKKSQNDSKLYIEVKDKDPLKDDLAGVCEIPLADVVKNGKTASWYDIFYKGKSAGQILVEIEWKPDQQSTNQNQNQPGFFMHPNLQQGPGPLPMNMGHPGNIPFNQPTQIIINTHQQHQQPGFPGHPGPGLHGHPHHVVGMEQSKDGNKLLIC